MRVLVLDDSLERQKAFRSHLIGTISTHVHSYAECVEAFENQPKPFDIVFLDHDLSDEAAAGNPSHKEKTGTDVVDYIVEMDPSKQPKKIILHTLNPVGRQRMMLILQRTGIETISSPFNILIPSETK